MKASHSGSPSTRYGVSGLRRGHSSQHAGAGQRERCRRSWPPHCTPQPEIHPWWRAWWRLVAGTQDFSRQTQGEDLVWMQRQSQRPQEWFRPLEVCIGPTGNPICQCTCEGSGMAPPESSFILSLLTEGAAPSASSGHTQARVGGPYARVGLKSELIPGGCLTFTEDSHHWQLPEHSTGRTS